jgi:hypothetical protein
MRGLVMGVNLVQNAFSAALGQALLPLAEDPLLIWNYGAVAILAAIGGVGFWFTWRDYDKKEDELNMLQATQYVKPMDIRVIECLRHLLTLLPIALDTWVVVALRTMIWRRCELGPNTCETSIAYTALRYSVSATEAMYELSAHIYSTPSSKSIFVYQDITNY